MSGMRHGDDGEGGGGIVHVVAARPAAERWSMLLRSAPRAAAPVVTIAMPRQIRVAPTMTRPREEGEDDTMKNRATLIGLLYVVAFACMPAIAFGQDNLVQIHQ